MTFPENMTKKTISSLSSVFAHRSGIPWWTEPGFEFVRRVRTLWLEPVRHVTWFRTLSWAAQRRVQQDERQNRPKPGGRLAHDAQTGTKCIRIATDTFEKAWVIRLLFFQLELVSVRIVHEGGEVDLWGLGKRVSYVDSRVRNRRFALFKLPNHNVTLCTA